MAKTKLVICPYCGETQPKGDRCRACTGLFEPLSRQATHNTMGPWYIRNPQRPFQPGCSYETLARLIDRGVVTKYSIIRGPTTRQFWTVARHVPGVSHLTGYCHACDSTVDPDDHGCANCGVPFGAYLDRNYLGLPEVRPLPWEAPDTEDRDHSPTPGLTWSSRGAREQRLSSFAPDEELFGTAGSRAHHGQPAPEPGQAGTPQHLPESAAETSAATVAAPRGEPFPRPDERTSGDDLLSPAVRSMQRRLERQQRTIRVLIGLVVVLALAGAVFNLIAVLSSGGEGAQDARDRTQAAVGDEVKAARSGARDKQQGEAVGGDEREANGAEAIAGAPVLADDLEEPAVEEPQPSGDERYDRAMALSRTAADPERSLDDRIADLQEALELLQQVESDVDGQPPADLADQIQRISDEIEYLKLKRFYP